MRYKKNIDELIEITGIKRKEDEEEQAYLFRLVTKIDELSEDVWLSLTIKAKYWVNLAISAIKANTTIPTIPSMGIKQEILKTRQNTISEKIENNGEILAINCERGKRYKIVIDTESKIVECIKILNNTIEVEDLFGGKYSISIDMRVIPLLEDTNMVIPQMNAILNNPCIIKSSKTNIPLTRYAKILMGKNPDITFEGLINELQKAGYDKINRMTIRTEYVDGKVFLDVLRTLGRLNETIPDMGNLIEK